jgi:hypothetical protein
VKSSVKWIYGSISLVALLVVGGWFSSPLLLKYYINHKIPGIQIESARLKSLDCVQLTGVSIRMGGTDGVLNEVIACRGSRTISIDGGEISTTINEGAPKKSSSYKITAHNLDMTLHVKGYVVYATEASLAQGRACGKHVFSNFGLGTVVVNTACVDLVTHQLTFEGGVASAAKDLAYPVGSIRFGQGSVDLTAKTAYLQYLTREPISIRDLHVDLNGKLVTLRASSIVGEHKRIYKDPLTIRDVVVGPIDIGAPFDRAVQASSRGASLTIDLNRWHIEGKEPCQKWLDAVPDELKTGPISEMGLKGDFAIDLVLKPAVRLRISNQCALVKGTPPKFIQALAGKFKYTVYHPDGTPFERETGPGASEWIPLQMVSPNMATALTTTEDPGFMYHRGIIPQAIENSLRDNLKLERFFRGGSTLTMQLAKNLWLNRTKTIGRKIQEAILTVALESALPKDKILELYLNVVEYGPNIYGIGPASREILHKDPLELSLSDAMYLVLRLPAPNHSASYDQMRGMIRKLLDNAMKAGKVTEDMVEIEKGQLTPMSFEDD